MTNYAAGRQQQNLSKPCDEKIKALTKLGFSANVIGNLSVKR